MRSEGNFTSTGKLKNIDWAAENTPVHWFHKEPILTYLANSYIIVTTEIERFTIKIARTLKDFIKEEQLRLEWELFIKEESAHAYQHNCVSNDLYRHKYPIKFMIKYSRLFFGLMYKVMSIKSKIALILSMEFYAHQMAVAAIENNILPKDELAIYDFLRWHAEEELSHFNLCLRVYHSIGGGYIRRVIAIIFFSLFVAFTSILFLPLFFCIDVVYRRKVTFKNIFTAYSYLFGRHGLFFERLKFALAYFNPKFNPSHAKPSPKKM